MDKIELQYPFRFKRHIKSSCIYESIPKNCREINLDKYKIHEGCIVCPCCGIPSIAYFYDHDLTECEGCGTEIIYQGDESPIWNSQNPNFSIIPPEEINFDLIREVIYNAMKEIGEKRFLEVKKNAIKA